VSSSLQLGRPSYIDQAAFALQNNSAKEPDSQEREHVPQFFAIELVVCHNLRYGPGALHALSLYRIKYISQRSIMKHSHYTKCKVGEETE